MTAAKNRMCRIIFALAVSLSFTGLASAADKATVSAQPDPLANPVLSSIQKLGTKLYYLGSRGGLDGWLIVKDGQIQIAYAAPNSPNLIIGALFGPSGENISSAQVDAVITEHPELKSIFMSTAKNPAAANTPLPNNVPGDPTAAIAAAQAQMQALAGLTAPPAMPQTSPYIGSKPLAAPGERLVVDLQNAAAINLGNPSAPLLYMVMDPTCSHCQESWKKLRDKVTANALQIRFIMINRDKDNAEEERVAAQLLHVIDPVDVWDKYVAGDKSQLAGKADDALIQSVRANRALIESWKIPNTPFFVYRARDGKVKIVQGEPAQPDDMIRDIAP